MYFLSHLMLMETFEMVHAWPLRYCSKIWKLKEAATEEVTGSAELSGLILYAVWIPTSNIMVFSTAAFKIFKTLILLLHISIWTVEELNQRTDIIMKPQYNL